LKLHLRNQVVSIRGVLRTYFHIFIWIWLCHLNLYLS
jgi:hypothetical protein